MAEMDIHGNLISRTRPVLPDTTYTPSSSYSSSYSSSSSRRYGGWWSRLNNGVIDFGNWINDNSSNIASVLVFIAAGITVISLLIWVVGVWADEGAFVGILSIFGAFFMGYIAFAIIGLASYVLGFAILAIRFLFWNIYTLLGTIAISAIITITSLSSINHTPGNNSDAASAQTEIITNTYYCTASSVLNVRSAPNGSAKVIGTIKHGQSIQVYNIVDGYAKFKYGSGYGYASTKYLRKAD